MWPVVKRGDKGLEAAGMEPNEALDLKSERMADTEAHAEHERTEALQHLAAVFLVSGEPAEVAGVLLHKRLAAVRISSVVRWTCDAQ